MKRIVLPIICVVSLAACQSAPKKVEAAKEPIEVTGSASSTMTTTPMVQTDPNVTVFSLEGPVENPLTVNRARGVLDNTTAGGYTVFDDSVTVYPLPGDDVPTYMPDYAVPPLLGQDVPGHKQAVGMPIGLASAGLLPPVPNVEVKAADPYANPPVPGMYSKATLASGARQPLTLTAPEPLTMQPPAEARPPMDSPFISARPDAGPRRAMLTSVDEGTPPVKNIGPAAVRVPTPPGAPVSGAVTGMASVGQTGSAAAAPKMTAGRRSGPSLTGY